MNLYKRIRAALLAARIECRWRYILYCRRRGENWIGRGEPLTSKRLLRLNDRINYHALRAKNYEKRYEMLYIPPFR